MNKIPSSLVEKLENKMTEMLTEEIKNFRYDIQNNLRPDQSVLIKRQNAILQELKNQRNKDTYTKEQPK